MKKLIMLMLLFTTIAMADTSVGFGEYSNCKSGYEVYFDKTVINHSRGEVLNIDFCFYYPTDINYRITREKNRIFVDFSYNDFNFPILPTLTYSVPVMLLPSFKEDKDEIEVNVRLYQHYSTEIGHFAVTPITYTQKVTVVATEDSDLALSDPTGSWYDTTLNGTGFTVMQFGNGTVVQYYGYDSDGKRLWLLSNVIDEAWERSEVKTLMMYEGQADAATNFTTPPAPAPGVAEWGDVEIRFDNCNSGYAKLSGADGVQTFNLTKLAMPSGIHCVAR